MNDILTTILDFLRRGQTLASATIMTREGSTPRTAGSKMLTDGHTLLAGSVGGGLLEARSLSAAAGLLWSTSSLTSGQPLPGQAEVLDFDLSGELAAGADMICGGKLRVFVEVLSPADLPFFESLADSLRQIRAVRSAVRLDGTARRLLVGGDSALDKAVCGLQSAVTVEGVDGTWFVEPWIVPPRLVLAGGGHVAQATASVAVVAGFGVTVLDDRAEFASAERFPQADTVAVVPEFQHCFRNIPMDGNTYVVILTRGHVHDASVLEQALAADQKIPVAYLGMIGSARKRDAIYNVLRHKGVAEASLAHVHCPVGLPIAAETPGEIAVSIIAECVAHKRKM